MLPISTPPLSLRVKRVQFPSPSLKWSPWPP
jgi:hypothetical protein